MGTQSIGVVDVVLWTNPSRAEIAMSILELMGAAVHFIGLGGGAGPAVDELAERLACNREDDLRRLLATRPVDFVLLTTAEGVDRADLAPALENGATVISLEPIAWEPAVSKRNRCLANAADQCTLQLVPGFDQCLGWTSAADPMQVVATPRLVGFTSWSRYYSSVYAQLWDAWRTVLHFGKIPEGVDASVVDASGRMPADLRAMSGHLAVHARLPGGVNGCTATIEVSSQAAVSSRELRVVGDDGQLIVRNDSYRLLGSDGNIVDSAEVPPKPPTEAELIAIHWRRLIEQVAVEPGAAALYNDDEIVTACCQATLLSARTGQSESPQKLLAVQGRS